MYLESNPILRIIPEHQLDALMAWVWKSLRQWVPGPGSDLSEYVPHVWTDGRGKMLAKLSEKSSRAFEREGVYAEPDVDPEWAGEVIATDDMRVKAGDGRWVTATCEVKIVYEPRGTILMGEWEEGTKTLRILANWSEVENLSSVLRGTTYEEQIDDVKLALRTILAHEIAHVVDASPRTGEDIVGSPLDVVLPWDQKAWTELYVRQGPEKRAIQREALEGLKTLRKLGYYDPDAKRGAFPWKLWNQLLDSGNNIRFMYESLKPAEKMTFMHELARGYKLFVRSLARRQKYGRASRT